MSPRACRALICFAFFAGLTTAVAVDAGPPPKLVFTDITADVGVALTSLNTESLAWGDYDNDGDPDLYLTSQGANNLFRNDGPTGINGAMAFTDVTATAGVGNTNWSVGTAFGDLDNDGDLDLYVVTFGSGIDVLYRNDGPVGPGGAYVFTDLTTADSGASTGITGTASSRGMAFVDFDRDGLLDIYVLSIGTDLLYRNLGGLVFQNVALTTGIVADGHQGVGVVASDVDGNGWPDLFVGNRSFNPNRLYSNVSGSLSDTSGMNGIDAIGLGMGVIALDYDNDLDMDLYWTAWPGSGTPVPNAFYENLGNNLFNDVAAVTGTEDTTGWGISANTADVDNDGFEDFAVTNGFDMSSTKNVLFHNEGNGTFSDATAVLEGGALFDGRGTAFADIDNDGDLDLAITGGPGASTRLWRNDSADGHWLTLDLVGTMSNRSAVGARVEVETDVRTVVKEVSGGAGRGSQNDLPLEFGLGAAREILEVRILWPEGVQETLTGVGMDQKLTVMESAIFTDGFESGNTTRWSLTEPPPGP